MVDWGALAHNRWVWAGAAGAAGLGAVAWYRRKKSGPAGAGATPSATSQTATYTPGGVGYLDSTGTDVAAQLGQYGQAVDQQLAQASQQWQSNFDQFTQTVTNKIAQIPTQAPTTPASNPSTPTTSVTVQEGNHVDPLLSLVRAYQPSFALSDLQALNPGITIGWANGSGYTSPTTPGAIPIFNVGTSAQVKIPAP